MSFDWNQFSNGSGFVKFENVGDAVAGEILAVTVGADFNNEPCPRLLIRTDDGEELTLTAGQKVLQSRLAETRPQVGERVGITYSGIGEAKPGKAPAKLFIVQVRGTDGQLRQAPAADEQAVPAPTPAAPPAPPVPAASAPSASSLV